MFESEELLLDGIEELKVNRSEYVNEIGSLRTLFNGLRKLNKSVKRSEVAFEKAGGDRVKVWVFGGAMESQHSLDVKACMFHWFGLSLCNYARLVGFVRGLHLGELVRADLTDKKGVEKVKKSI